MGIKTGEIKDVAAIAALHTCAEGSQALKIIENLPLFRAATIWSPLAQDARFALRTFSADQPLLVEKKTGMSSGTFNILSDEMEIDDIFSTPEYTAGLNEPAAYAEIPPRQFIFAENVELQLGRGAVNLTLSDWKEEFIDDVDSKCTVQFDGQAYQFGIVKDEVLVNLRGLEYSTNQS